MVERVTGREGGEVGAVGGTGEDDVGAEFAVGSIDGMTAGDEVGAVGGR